MNATRRLVPFVLALVLAAGCAPKKPVTASPTPAATVAAASPTATPMTNPLLQQSTLPMEYPPFDKIKDADFTPAFEAGMAEQRKEIDAIKNDPAAPTFDNTIVAMEKSGRTLTRVSKVFFNLDVSNPDDEIEKIASDVTPKLQAHSDAIFLDTKLFARVDAVWKQRDTLGLDAESKQLVDRYETLFVRAGAKLSDADKEELKKINAQLSSFSVQFQQTVIKGRKDAAIVVDDVKQLDGLSDEQIGAAAQAAKDRGLDGKWVLLLENTTGQGVLDSLKDRSLRERIHKASIARGVGGPDDTTAIIAKVVPLRAREAQLLGYPDWASYQLADEGAKTTAAVNDILAGIGKGALDKARKDAADLQAEIDAEAKAGHTKSFALEPWDWSFYAAKLRKKRLQFDDAEVKPYFELDRVLQDGLFWAANQLYGITFKERHDLPVYEPSVRVFDVVDADGSPLGILLLDYFKREGKQGGAWMDSFVDPCELFGTHPVVINNLNIPKPAPGQPVLLSFDDVNGMFHEFGHALHGLFAHTKYPLVGGTSVPRDFVEFPSQFNEMWSREPVVVAHFAKHYKTGEPMPKALLDKVIAAQTFDAGYSTSELIEAASLDQSWHQIAAKDAPPADQVPAFEEAALKKKSLFYAPVPPRYHSPYFLHIFFLGYDAGYYAYIWSEVLARDAGKWFHEHGGLTRENGQIFRDKILSRGRTQEPDVLWKNFYGKPPEVGPLLEYRGLVTPSKTK